MIRERLFSSVSVRIKIGTKFSWIIYLLLWNKHKYIFHVKSYFWSSVGTYISFLPGNICRSPIAEGVFQKTVNDKNLGDQWEIDSAAIGGWHVGNPPDWRAIDTMKKHNVPYSNHARQVRYFFSVVLIFVRQCPQFRSLWTYYFIDTYSESVVWAMQNQ